MNSLLEINFETSELDFEPYRVNFDKVSLNFYCNDSETIEYLINLYSPTIEFIPQEIIGNGYTNISAFLINSEKLIILKEKLRGEKLRRITLHGGSDPEFYCTGLKFSSEHETIILIENTESILCIDRANHIYLFSDTSKKLYTDAERIFMDIFGRKYEINEIAFHFHSSAAEKKGKSLMFIGNKNAGKTTFVTHLLLNYGFNYLSNDNNFLSIDNDKQSVIVKPWGYYYKIKKETLENYPEIYNRIKNDNSITVSKDNKYKINTNRILTLFNTEFLKRSYLGAIIHLNYNEERPTSYRKISNEKEYYNIISRHVYIPHDPDHYNFLGIEEDFSAKRLEQYNNFSEFLFGNIQLYEFSYNSDWKTQFDEFYSLVMKGE